MVHDGAASIALPGFAADQRAEEALTAPLARGWAAGARLQTHAEGGRRWVQPLSNLFLATMCLWAVVTRHARVLARSGARFQTSARLRSVHALPQGRQGRPGKGKALGHARSSDVAGCAGSTVHSRPTHPPSLASWLPPASSSPTPCGPRSRGWPAARPPSPPGHRVDCGNDHGLVKLRDRSRSAMRLETCSLTEPLLRPRYRLVREVAARWDGCAPRDQHGGPRGWAQGGPRGLLREARCASQPSFNRRPRHLRTAGAWKHAGPGRSLAELASPRARVLGRAPTLRSAAPAR